MSRDTEHLKLLTIFHYVFAGVHFVTSSIPIIHVVLGVAMVSGAIPTPAPPPGGTAPPGPSPALMGWLFIVVGGAIMCYGYLMSALVAFAGWNLSRRRRWTFCLVVDCLCCLSVPLGTALGVCSILVLSRQSVKDIFAGKVVEARHPEDEEEERERLPVLDAERADDDRYYSPR